MEPPFPLSQICWPRNSTNRSTTKDSFFPFLAFFSKYENACDFFARHFFRCAYTFTRSPTDQAKEFVRVWRHEITRVIFDRLINEDDQVLVREHLVALLEAHYHEKLEFIMRDPILYGDYTNTLDPSEPRLYESIEDFETAQVRFYSFIHAFIHSFIYSFIHSFIHLLLHHKGSTHYNTSK